MYIGRNFSARGILSFSGTHLIWLTLWGTFCVSMYEFTNWHWLAIPWLPISIVGTAVAFYVGFKNNSSYDRMWEARKIWGGIVNDSRLLGISVKHFINDLFSESKVSEYEIKRIHRKLLFRHIAWLYTLRNQLLVTAPWEHLHENTNRHIRRVNNNRIKTFGLGVLGEDDSSRIIQQYLESDEWVDVQKKVNPATHLIDYQAKEFSDLRRENLLDDFRHMEMQNILSKFYDHQGKCERIKNYPLPRQYAASSFLFVAVFIFLLPFGMLEQFEAMGEGLIWLTVPFVTIVGWVFIMMELIGDYSENPFEGLGNDIPMKSLCRIIEIDLLEMLGEENIPEKIQAVNKTLM